MKSLDRLALATSILVVAGASLRAQTEARNAAGYSRPHELEIGRVDEGGGFWATVIDVRRDGVGSWTLGVTEPSDVSRIQPMRDAHNSAISELHGGDEINPFRL